MSAPTPEQIRRLIEAKDRLENDVAFYDSLEFEDEVIEGTRYKYTFNGALEG